MGTELICTRTTVARGTKRCLSPAFYRIIYVEPLDDILIGHDIAVCDRVAHLKSTIDEALGAPGVESVMVHPV